MQNCGTLSEENQTLTIIGGGATGLAAAYMAAKAGYKTRIIEQDHQLGGLLGTFPIADNRLEIFYHHFFIHDAEILWLLKDLNLEQFLLFNPTTMGVFRKGQIYNFNSPMDLFKFSPLPIIDKIRFGATSLYLGKIAKWRNYENIPAIKWFESRAGRGTSDSLWKPLLKVKFGPYADRVPLAWMIGRLRQRMNSRSKGEEKLGYLSGSLQRLVDRLKERLLDLGAEIIVDTSVDKLIVENNTLKGVKTSQGSFFGGKFLFTIPQVHVADLMREPAPIFAEQLARIEYFGAVCTVIELSRSLSPIYWLNIADEELPFGGIIEHTNFIPSHQYGENHIVYLSRYFALHEQIATMDDEQIKKLMLDSLPLVYPDFKVQWIKQVHVFRTNTAATVCDLNFSDKISFCKTEVQNCYLANMSHIYPDERSVNNAIRIAAAALQCMELTVDQPPYGSSLSGNFMH